MNGPGVERVRYTCERYKLHETTHVDVLSYYAIRNDWDHTHPASGIRNLTAGRYRVLEEFAKHGVDVSSEAMRYPMIGHISNFWYGQFSSACPFGGSIIPLLPLIYRKSAVWGYSGGSKADHAVRSNQSALLWTAARTAFFAEILDRAEITDTWYLGLLPWIHLHSLNIESFDREGRPGHHRDGRELAHRAGLGQKELQHSCLNGVEVARDDSTFCPVDKDKIAFLPSHAANADGAIAGGMEGGGDGTPPRCLSTNALPADFHVDGNQIKVSSTVRNSQSWSIATKKQHAWHSWRQVLSRSLRGKPSRVEISCAANFTVLRN